MQKSIAVNEKEGYDDQIYGDKVLYYIEYF